MPEKNTGVNGAAAAGQQEGAGAQQDQELDFSAYFSGEGAGEGNPADAGQGTGSEAGEGQGAEGSGSEEKFDEKTEKAFAKRLAAERKKLEQEYEEKFGQPPGQGQQQGQQQTGPQKTWNELVDELADKLYITKEAADIMLRQQVQLEQMNNQLTEIRGGSEKTTAQQEIETMRAQNPHLPEFNETAVTKIRNDYSKQYGVPLSWKDAYRQFVAQEALNGKLFADIEHETEQRTLTNVAGRDTKTIQAGQAGRAKPPSINDMSDDQFEQMIEAAKQGKLKKS